ncbi:MAG: hypothetical protein V7L23_24420 [Nostoc sp.]
MYSKRAAASGQATGCLQEWVPSFHAGNQSGQIYLGNKSKI